MRDAALGAGMRNALKMAIENHPAQKDIHTMATEMLKVTEKDNSASSRGQKKADTSGGDFDLSTVTGPHWVS